MKKNLTKVMAMGMVMTILAGTTAFANEAATEPLLISEAANTKAEEAVTTEAEAAESKYLAQEGTVESVEASATEGVSIVTIQNEQGGLRFAVASDTIIVNREDGSYMTADKLEKGMAVAVVYAVNSPMGLSMPPYLGQVAAVVANADAGFFAVGKFDNELTDMKNMLKLNIDNEKTSIVNVQGSKIRLTDEDVKGQDALVFYGATTKSLPAQTTPSFVLLLTQAEEETEVETEAETVKEREVQAQTMVPLRETAEENGFSVTWQGKTKPVLLEKDGVSLELMLGDKIFVANGEEEEAVFKTELRDGVMFVSNEIFA